MRTRLATSLAAFIVAMVGPAEAQDANSIAQRLCHQTVDAFTRNPQALRSLLGRQALQTVAQQTSGSGVYPMLQQAGPAQGLNVVNPHVDQDRNFGSLFHFYCSTRHRAGTLNWDLKFAPSTNRLEFFSFRPAQQMQQPTVFGQPLQRQQPQQRNQPAPRQEPRKPAPTREEACRMFPGMC